MGQLKKAFGTKLIVLYCWCPSVSGDNGNLHYDSVCGWVTAPTVAVQAKSRSEGSVAVDTGETHA